MKKQQGFTLIELMIVVAIIAILAAIAIPQYQAYVARSQAARVFGEAGQIKTAVEDCMNNGKYTEGVKADECDTGKTGSTIQSGGTLANGGTPPAGTGVPVVKMADTGVATIQATLGNRASSRINTKTLTWSRDGDGTWACATTIEARYAPSGCTPP